MAPSAAIDIPTVQQDEEQLFSSLDAPGDDIFSPVDSLSTSVSSTSVAGDFFETTLENGANDGQWQLDHLNSTVPAISQADPNPNGLLVEECTATKAVPFGRGPDAWYYRPDSGIFDLSRQASRQVHVPSHTQDMTGLLLDPDRTILVVVDMQNFFIHPACHAHPAGVRAVEPTLEVMSKCRELGIQISFLNWVIEEKDMFEMPPAVQRGWSHDRLKTHGVGWHINLGSELPHRQGRCLWKGSWNAELYAPIKEAAQTEDVVFLKNRPSGMWSTETDMALYLAKHNKKTVLFAGVNTDQCVLGTLTDCYSKSYDCVMVSDCVGTATTHLMAQELVEYNVARNYGFVVDSACMMRCREVKV